MWTLRIIAKAITGKYKIERLFVKLLDILLDSQRKFNIYGYTREIIFL